MHDRAPLLVHSAVMGLSGRCLSSSLVCVLHEDRDLILVQCLALSEPPINSG